MTPPILTYGSEIWIADHKINIENLHNLSFEKTQNMIMTQILGVHGKSLILLFMQNWDLNHCVIRPLNLCLNSITV